MKIDLRDHLAEEIEETREPYTNWLGEPRERVRRGTRTRPKKKFADHPIFSTFEPCKGGSHYPNFAYKLHCRIDGKKLELPDAVLKLELSGKWSAKRSMTTDTTSRQRRKRINARFYHTYFWFENEEDIILLKLAGFPFHEDCYRR